MKDYDVTGRNTQFLQHTAVKELPGYGTGDCEFPSMFSNERFHLCFLLIFHVISTPTATFMKISARHPTLQQCVFLHICAYFILYCNNISSLWGLCKYYSVQKHALVALPLFFLSFVKTFLATL